MRQGLNRHSEPCNQGKACNVRMRFLLIEVLRREFDAHRFQVIMQKPPRGDNWLMLILQNGGHFL